MPDELRQRQPRVEDKAFLAFVRTRRCCSCGAPPPSHAAHIRMACRERGKRETGKGERPSDRYATPMCQTCHLDGPGAQHKGPEAAFWRRVGVDPFAVAAALYAEFTSAHASRSPKRPSQAKGATYWGAKVRRPKRKRPAHFTFAADKSKPKMKSRPLRSASRWPKRTMRGRR